jgi:molecular chaperone IbpA
MTTRTLTLRSLDVPSVHKFGIGFDGMFNELLKMSEQSNVNYPPYNIVKQTEDKFYIEIATAGFAEGEIKISVENHMLSVVGEKEFVEDQPAPEYLHRGISSRSFDRSFRLGEHVEVLDAQNRDGILTVYLERQVPEALQPKTIDIKYIK